MKGHIIYVEEGDTVRIRPVNSDFFDVSAKGWREQTRPTEHFMMIDDSETLGFHEDALMRPSIRIGEGDKKKFI